MIIMLIIQCDGLLEICRYIFNALIWALFRNPWAASHVSLPQARYSRVSLLLAAAVASKARARARTGPGGQGQDQGRASMAGVVVRCRPAPLPAATAALEPHTGGRPTQHPTRCLPPHNTPPAACLPTTLAPLGCRTGYSLCSTDYLYFIPIQIRLYGFVLV